MAKTSKKKAPTHREVIESLSAALDELLTRTVDLSLKEGVGLTDEEEASRKNSLKAFALKEAWLKTPEGKGVKATVKIEVWRGIAEVVRNPASINVVINDKD